MLSHRLNPLILGAAFLVLVPVLSLDVAMEFLGRVDMLKPDEVDLLQDMFIMAYNQEDEEAQGNGNGNKNGNGNGNNGNRRVSSVKIDNTNSVESSTLLLEESVSQPFMLMAQVSCDGCKHDSLFSTKAGNGTFKDHAKFGLDVEVFASRFNDAITTLGGYLPVSYLSALQQIESAPCGGATDREYSLHKVVVSGQYVRAKGVDEISHEDHRILQQVFLDTYNFLNTVSTSRRCDKLSRRVESVRDDDDTTATRRRLMSPYPTYRNFTFNFNIDFGCLLCGNSTGLFDDDAGRRLMHHGGVKMENDSEEHHYSARSLGGAVDEKTNTKCICPVHAEKFGSVPRQEFVLAFDDAIQLLQKQGLLASIDGVLDVVEGRATV